MSDQNQTRQDAYERVLTARMGSLANKPTDEYLLALTYHIQIWLDEIKCELHSRVEEAIKREADY